MAPRIYTRTGDQGETGLLGGGRVAKSDARVEAYGSVDELNAALGWVRSLGPPAALERQLGDIQSLLFELGAQLATGPKAKERPAGVSAEDVTRLESEIDAAQAGLPALQSFVLPGGAPVAAALHLARTICRRAERRCVALRERDLSVPVLTVIFLNRLGDLLFVLARAANHEAGRPDVPWQARGN